MTSHAGGPTRAATLLRLALVAAAAALVANCGGAPREAARRGPEVDPRYGVKPSPRVIAEGEPVPKGGGREMVGKPYTVGGRTYVPRDDRRYAKQGLASWYGAAFHGRLTANGEVFDQESLAAAHPTLPLPSYARVTNISNGHSVIVRVNDRGPYHENRLIDVSQRAAEALGFRRVGTTQVRVEYVGRASLQGSDDAKLMATLRTDGRQAPFRGPAPPTMIAAAEPRPAGPPRPVASSAPLPISPTPISPVPISPMPLQVAAAEPTEEDETPAPYAGAAVRAEATSTRPSPAASASAPPLPPTRPVALASAGSAPRGGTEARRAPMALSYAATGQVRAASLR